MANIKHQSAKIQATSEIIVEKSYHGVKQELSAIITKKKNLGVF